MLCKSDHLLSILYNKLNTYSFNNGLELRNSSFLLSFSGGVDSALLASLMVEIRNRYNIRLGFVHFNHNSHKNSIALEDLCLRYSIDNNVKIFCYKLFFSFDENFESCARKKRYKILNMLAERYSYNFILTAHHQDDQIETIYMKTEDGSDWISQIGIRERMNKLCRPFLDIAKKEIKQCAIQKNIQWIEDPTNYDISILRNYVRHCKLPYAIRLETGLKSKLLKSAQKNKNNFEKTIKKIKKDKKYLIQNFTQNYLQIDRNIAMSYTIQELKLFIYKYVNVFLGVRLRQQTGGAWREFKKFINQSNTGSVFKMGCLTFNIDRETVYIINNYEKLRIKDKLQLYNGATWFSGKFIIDKKSKLCNSHNKSFLMLPENLYKEGLYIRQWNDGDKAISSTSNNHVKISDIFINNKLSKYEKMIQPIVVNRSDRILWIPGLLHGNVTHNQNTQMKVINWIEL